MQDVIKKLILDISVDDKNEYKTIKNDIQAYVETELTENIKILLDSLAPKDVIIELDKIALDCISIKNKKSNPLELKNLKNSINQSLQKNIKKAIDDSIADPQKRNIHPLPIALFNAMLNYLKNGYFDWWISAKNQKSIEQIYVNLLNNHPELIRNLWYNSNLGKNLNAIKRFTSQFNANLIQNTIKIITKDKYNAFNSIFSELDSVSHLIKEQPLNKYKYQTYLYTSIIFNSSNPISLQKEELLDCCINTLSSIAGLSKQELKHLTKINNKNITQPNSIAYTTEVIKTLDSVVNNENTNKSDLELDIIVDALKDLYKNISPTEARQIAKSLEKINPQSLFVEKIVKKLKPEFIESFLRYKEYFHSINDDFLHKNLFSQTLKCALQRNESISEYNIEIDNIIKKSISNENISSHLESYLSTSLVPKQYNTDQDFFNFFLKKEENTKILYSVLKKIETKAIPIKILEQFIKPFILRTTSLSNTDLSEYEENLSENLYKQNITINKSNLKQIIYINLLSTIFEKKSNANLLKTVTNNISKSLEVNLENLHKKNDRIDLRNEIQKLKTDDLKLKKDTVLTKWIEFIDLGEIDSYTSPKQLLNEVYSLPDSQKEKILTTSLNSSLARNRIIAYFNLEEIKSIILYSTNKNIPIYAQEILDILSDRLKQTSNIIIYNICIDKFLTASIAFNKHRKEKTWLKEVLSLIKTEIDLSKKQLTNILLSSAKDKPAVDYQSLNQLLSELEFKIDDNYAEETNTISDINKNSTESHNESFLVDFLLYDPKIYIKERNPNSIIIEKFIKKHPQDTIQILFRYSYMPNMINNIVNNLNKDIIYSLIKIFSPLSYTWIKDNILTYLPDNPSEEQKIIWEKKNMKTVLEYFIYINKENNKNLDRDKLTQFWSNSIYELKEIQDLTEDINKNNINTNKEIDQNSEEKILYIDNGSIAILWPFLESLFERLGLMKKSEFIDTASTNNAIHIINYLCCNKLSTSEWKLVLPKILCGVNPETTIYFSYEPNSGPLPKYLELIDSKYDNEEVLIEKLKSLEEKEQNIYLEIYEVIEICNKWLNDIIKEWPELIQLKKHEEFQNNFTLEDFKQYFLKRKCILRKITKADNIFWHLTIPIYQYDTDKLMPNWSLESIDLPWKKEKLIIHWM